ncbi:MAG TPA: helix-turn-helix transcriptional regulator [Acidobacteriaceae bacterium]|nr:helix-turn-helix transcriptional regulator [Acidobacteriaceae bacterium]
MKKAALPLSFGRAVRRLREQAGYSQERFAAQAHIDRTYMSEIERGTTNVSLEIIGRLARTLGIDLADLFAEVDREAK